MIDFTTCIAVDERHADELEIVWNSWVQFKPEILQQPLHVYCDDVRTVKWWCHRLAFLNAHHDNWHLYMWPADFSAVHRPGIPAAASSRHFPPDWSQREKMLSAFVFGVAETVKTPWFLKIDSDTVATGPGEWLPDWWTEGEPAYCSSPWSYSKPGSMFATLDEWAAGIPELAAHQPPPRRIVGNIAKSKRVISFVYLGNTAWHRRLVGWCGDRLPVPSQDTLSSYCSARCGDFVRRVQMKHCGWRHIGGGGVERLRAAVAAALGPAGVVA